MNLNKKDIKTILLIILYTIVLFTIFENIDGFLGIFTTIFHLVFPIILGLCIAFVLNIFMSFIEKNIFGFMEKSKFKRVRKMRRGLSVLLTFILCIGVIAIVLCVVIPSFVETITSFANNLPEYIENAYDWGLQMLKKMNISQDKVTNMEVDWNNFLDKAMSMLSDGSKNVVDFATNISSSFFSALFDLILGVIIAIYVLLKKERIQSLTIKTMKAFMPEKVYTPILRIASLSKEAFSNFITGQLIEACILGILCFIGMLIFKFPCAAVVSVFIAATALIPMFGAWLGGGVGAFLILFISPIKAVLFIVYIIVLQQIETNMIYPKVVGKSVGLPGLVVLVAVIIGTNLFGVVGILFSVPICSILYGLWLDALDRREIDPKEESTTETDSDCESKN